MFISSRLRAFLVLIRTYIISQIRLYQEHNVAVKLPLSFRKKKHLTFNFAAFAYNRLFQNTLLSSWWPVCGFGSIFGEHCFNPEGVTRGQTKMSNSFFLSRPFFFPSSWFPLPPHRAIFHALSLRRRTPLNSILFPPLPPNPLPFSSHSFLFIPTPPLSFSCLVLISFHLFLFAFSTSIFVVFLVCSFTFVQPVIGQGHAWFWLSVNIKLNTWLCVLAGYDVSR